MHDIQKCTKCLSISEDMSHILYIYNEIDKYVDNAVSFILEGLVNNEAILFIETEEFIERIKGELVLNGFDAGSLRNLIFTDSVQAYLAGGQLNVKSDKGLISLLAPFLEEGYTVRTWGRMPLTDYDSSLEELRIYESKADHYTAGRKAVSVCAYNGLTIPAYIQNELLKTHTHFMTDREIQLSPFYSRENLQFPTSEEMERLRRLEKQNNELKERNQHLIYENNLVKIKNEMVMQNEQKIRNIIDQLPIPTIIRRNDHVLFLNGVAREVFCIGNGIMESGHELHPFFDECDQNPVYCNGIFQFKQYDNEKYFLIKSIEIVFEGKPAKLHTFVDITQERENEKLMIRSVKMNIAGELAASIAHELRNPLTAIKGFFHMLKETGHGNELYYSVIEDELSRIEQILSELLTLAKPHSNNWKNHNIIQLINDVIMLLTPQANMKNIEMLLKADRGEIYLQCENTKIKQVFINLIKNAIDAMENGGNIILTVKETTEEMIEIKIIDQGIGIPKELLHKIGEPFYTTKEKGTGIGMMVCFQIIESHRGTIQVDSKVNVGTTFTITLPKEESSLIRG